MLIVGSHKAEVRRTCPGLALGCRHEGQEPWNSLAGRGTEEEITSWLSPSCLRSLGSLNYMLCSQTSLSLAQSFGPVSISGAG